MVSVRDRTSRAATLAILFAACLSLSAAELSVTGSQQQKPSLCTRSKDNTLINCSSLSLTSIPLDISPLATLVTHLDLHGNRIHQMPSDEVHHDGNQNDTSSESSDQSSDQWPALANLIHLDLSQNDLTDLRSNWLTSLIRLQNLNASDNRISTLPIHELCTLTRLRHINLANNQITSAPYTDTEGNQSSLVQCNLPDVVSLDLSGNNLSSLPEPFLQGLSELRLLNLSRNFLTGLPANLSQSLVNLKQLDLSHNLLSELETTDWFSYLHGLTHLYLNHNNITTVSSEHFSNNLLQLRVLSLDHNPLMHIHAFSFYGCNNLQTLDLSSLTLLHSVHHQAFKGLHALRVLNLSDCSRLAYLHADTFDDLANLEKLDIRNNALTTLFEPLLRNMTNSTEIYLAGNPFVCDCEMKWLYTEMQSKNSTLQLKNVDKIVCNSPSYLQGLTLAYLDGQEFVKSGPLITNYTSSAYATIGSSVVLNCVVSGCPHPVITWTTPRNQVFRYDPASIHWGKPQPVDDSFHAHHHWHLDDDTYFHGLPQNEHMYVLQNGSLFIDYVKRTDAGNYTCFVENSFGNDTVLIEFKLDYELFMHTIAFSVLVGYACAACFFLLTIVFAVIRYVSYVCSKEQRQKRKSIYSILESLDNYRSASLGKLRDYRSAKMDQLSAYKSAKVDKLRNYKNLYYTTLVSYTEKMRENYTHSLNRIKDNCRQQMDNLRDNYSSQKGKFKDYRSHQIDKLQDNYNTQVVKIREYGASQVAKLREQYKLQQQHIMKILEVLDVGSCMTVIEAECLRTESALFDDLDFDLGAPPKKFLQFSPDSEFETYETAESSDVGSIQNIKGEDGTDHPLSASARPSDLPIDEARKQKRKKQKYQRHRRQPSNISTDTSISQGTPEIIPVRAQVIPHRDSSMEEEGPEAKMSSPSAYVSAMSENGSNTEYDSAISRPNSLGDIPEKCNNGTPTDSPNGTPVNSCQSTPTMKADVAIAIEAEDEMSMSLSPASSMDETYV